MEKSKAEPIEKINAALLVLYPEDMQHIEKALYQTLTNLNQKI